MILKKKNLLTQRAIKIPKITKSKKGANLALVHEKLELITHCSIEVKKYKTSAEEAV